MTQAFNLSQFANFLNTSGQLSLTGSGITGALGIANGGTNNGSLAVTAGGVLYTDGTKIVNVGAGTSGQALLSQGAGAPIWGSAGATGTLKNIQYFTSTATYTATSGTTFVIVEVVGGGGGGRSFNSGSAAGAGGTTSFGALVSATGGGAGGVGNGGAGGTGSSGDLNITGGKGCANSASSASGISVGGGIPAFYASWGCFIIPQTSNASSGYGVGGSCSTPGQSGGSGGGGGYARKKITSAFSGVTVTIGGGGSSPEGANWAGTAGLCVVYEYA